MTLTPADHVIAQLNATWPGIAWISPASREGERRLTIDVSRKDVKDVIAFLEGRGGVVTATGWEHADITLDKVQGQLSSQSDRNDGARLIARALLELEERLGTPVLELVARGSELPSDVLDRVDWQAIAATDDERNSRWAIVATAEAVGQALPLASDVPLDDIGETLATLLIDLNREAIMSDGTMYDFYDQLFLVSLAIDSGIDLVGVARRLAQGTRGPKHALRVTSPKGAGLTHER